MIAGGARRKLVSQRMALVMAAVGAYLLVFFGGVVGFRAL